MDYLDPHKQRTHTIRLFVGYFLIGAAVLIGTTILLYWAYGFGLNKDGKVIQNGLVFVSSQPGNADIYIDGKQYKDKTNTRMQLPEGEYSLDVRRQGYHDWHRDIQVTGSSVSRYDYPLLIPTNLTTKPLKTYASLPGLATQSPDRKWLVVQKPGSQTSFDVYDFSNPAKVTDSVQEISLPSGIVKQVEGDQSWKMVEWSNDNRRVILQHDYSGGSEYVLLDHADPASSVNLTDTLQLSPGQVVALRDKKYDKYYIHDPATGVLQSVSLGTPTDKSTVLTGVLAYKSYAENMILYATQAGAKSGQVMTKLLDGDITYKIREVGQSPDSKYLMDLAQYDGDWYVAVGANVDNREYVFKNPQAARKSGNLPVLVPAYTLRVNSPNYLAFSSNTRFIMVENSTSFAVYDAEAAKAYTYNTALALDDNVQHATWMDGDRIVYVNGNKVIMFDYDNINMQTLVSASPAFAPFFDRDYNYLYALTPPTQATGQSLLTSTPLLAPKDL